MPETAALLIQVIYRESTSGDFFAAPRKFGGAKHASTRAQRRTSAPMDANVVARVAKPSIIGPSISIVRIGRSANASGAEERFVGAAARRVDQQKCS
jgi:hypothetical protein